MEAIRVAGKPSTEQQRRSLLARFGVTGEMAHQAVRSLSGGERSRVALAWLAAQEANVLVLDEPTNHLDLWARDALERAIRNYRGTVLLVSHDRYFLNRVVDHMIVMDDGQARVVIGNYDTLESEEERTIRGTKAATTNSKRDGKRPAATDEGEPRKKRNSPTGS